MERGGGSTGLIVWFVEARCFGFITPDDGSKDVFAHVADNPNLEHRQGGETVTFELACDFYKDKHNGVNLNFAMANEPCISNRHRDRVSRASASYLCMPNEPSA